MTEVHSSISELEDKVIDAIRTCYDPEIPVNIYELGLIYGVDIDPTGYATITMTLTTPHCPAAASLPAEVKERVKGVSGITDAKVDVVWDPMWNTSMMSESAKLELGFL